MAMAAFTGQMPVALIWTIKIEWHAKTGQPPDRFWRVFDDELHRLTVVQAAARNHRVLNVAFKRIARFQHCRDPALCPCRRAIGQGAFRQHRHLIFLRQLKRGCQSGGT